MPDSHNDTSASKAIISQPILLSLIKPNPANRFISQDDINTMAESLKQFGLNNPVKVRPLPDGTYILFSGHIRRAGALKLGWETIAAVISDKTPEETTLEGIWDNRQKSQSWLDDYRDIEALEAVNPDITNEQLAKKLDAGMTAIKRVRVNHSSRSKESPIAKKEGRKEQKQKQNPVRCFMTKPELLVQAL